MVSTPAPKKVKHQSRSVEHHVDRPREDVWPEVVAMVRDRVGPAKELSFEPPWRLAYEMDTMSSALGFWQGTVLIRNDGPTCHVAWGLVFDPEPSPAVLAAVDEILAAMAAELERLADGFDG